MKVHILGAKMTHAEDTGFVGHVQFEVENHKRPYEITLQSSDGKRDWSYALNFLNEPGSEEEIQAVDEQLEESDAFFEQFVTAVKQA
ncbi:hypothetical protein SD71_17245 [Cohnella kolymensis]|uniref:Uncharacterized protein n=1 Tax=Cohnella kolymensis TaxID=1590652 RepID=A0ABR5A302_9BACL|nr:hypothetical protein [Cohnella kolymensis]KIL34782.1 hypothetical protein SD71_17245 [Cohnella kolymensis]